MVIRFSIPMMLSSFVHQLYSVADSYFVGNLLSSQELAVLGATASVTYSVSRLPNVGTDRGINVLFMAVTRLIYRL